MKTNILFLSILLLFSCTKFGKTYRVKGKVINPITGEGFAGAEVSLSRNTIGIPGGSKVQKTVKTDENGNFDISKLAVRNDGVAVLGIANSEFDIYRIGWTKDGGKTFALGMGAKFGKTIHADYYAVPYGEISINIKNIECVDSNDKIELFFDGGEFDGNTFTIGFMTVLYGCQDIPGTPVKSSMGNKYFHWNITKNGVTNTIYDTIFVTEAGVTNLDVYY